MAISSVPSVHHGGLSAGMRRRMARPGMQNGLIDQGATGTELEASVLAGAVWAAKGCGGELRVW